MRCAADRADTGRLLRRYGRRVAAWLLCACMIAACSSAGSGHAGKNPVRLGPFARGRIVVVPGPAGGFLAVPGAAGSSGRPKITVPPIPPASSGQPISLPLNAYADVSGQQQTVLVEAQSLLTQKCMADRGFVYFSETTSVQEQAILQSLEYGFGVTSLGNATTYGYGQPPDSSGPPPVAVFLGGFSSFSQLKQEAALAVALLGFAPGVRIAPVHEEGCLNIANGEIYGRGISPVGDPVPSIAQQAGMWTQTDPRVLAVNAAWSRCMARRGYHYTSPEQPASHNWPAKPTKKEAATAVADVTCKQQTNLANTWLTVEAAYQTALIGENIGTLASLQSSFQKALTHVEDLLDSPTGLPPANLGPGGRAIPARPAP
jgi:hypothetical protein